MIPAKNFAVSVGKQQLRLKSKQVLANKDASPSLCCFVVVVVVVVVVVGVMVVTLAVV